MLDCEGNVTSWNTGAALLKGYRADEVLGRPHRVFYTAEDQASGRPGRLLDTARVDGRAEDEGWSIRKNGATFWAKVVITALYDDTGVFRGYAKTQTDG